VREALFSILGDVEGLDVLDLYAGSGALGLEALSRGARHATFVEAAHAATQAIRANVDALAVRDRTRIVAGDVKRALKGVRATFGLVFLDPPYAAEGVAQVLDALTASGALIQGAWIVLEHAARSAPPAGTEARALRFTRTYGDTALTFYRHEALEAE
jgi:16S rRNA (guanine966-N2)-methyltransferase